MIPEPGHEPIVDELERADYLIALGRLLNAGVAPDRAVASAAGRKASVALAAAARKAAAAMLAGRDAGTALSEAGLLGRQESKILSAALGAGEPGPWVERIGADITARHERRRRLRGTMWLPLAVVVAALLLAPLPDLLTGEIGAAAYLTRTLGSIGGLLLVVAGLSSLTRRWSVRPRTLLRDRIRLGVPLFGGAQARREVAQWCRSMSMLLEAGVAVDRAAALAVGGIGNRVIAAAFAPVEGRVAGGEALAAALMGNRWISGPAHELIATGEQSGRLADALGRIAVFEQGRVERFDAEAVRWTPRLLYIALILWLALGLVAGGGLPIMDR
jgi:general secretion pathway protein F